MHVFVCVVRLFMNKLKLGVGIPRIRYDVMDACAYLQLKMFCVFEIL